MITGLLYLSAGDDDHINRIGRMRNTAERKKRGIGVMLWGLSHKQGEMFPEIKLDLQITIYRAVGAEVYSP